ncbi:MAG: BolA family transcriptional regulator [Rhodospirillales bacterium]|nr:BolA family transcriptional regulator [Rhodospirillales bacterium]
MKRHDTIEQTLRTALSPDRLEVIDESAQHAGHAGARPGGETHFRVEVVSSKFQGLSRIERQRLIYGLLDDELAGGLHALSIRALAPGE